MISRNIWMTVLGFVIAGTGFLALVLSLVGIQLSFLTWIEYPGRLFGFLAKVVMVMAGVIILYIYNSDFEGQRAR